MSSLGLGGFGCEGAGSDCAEAFGSALAGSVDCVKATVLETKIAAHDPSVQILQIVRVMRIISTLNGELPLAPVNIDAHLRLCLNVMVVMDCRWIRGQFGNPSHRLTVVAKKAQQSWLPGLWTF